MLKSSAFLKVLVFLRLLTSFLKGELILHGYLALDSVHVDLFIYD